MLSVNHLGISASFSETLGDEGGGSSTSPEGSSVMASSASTSELKALAASCRAASLLSHCDPSPQVSPAFFKFSDLAPDCGMLQSELFTSRSQNLVLAKLRNSGFWRYGQFFK